MVFLRHPSWADLNRFADGELSPSRQRQVSEHLAGCSRCRREVAFVRQAGQLARSLETPPVPEEILDRVLERRAEGDRVLLPLESPGARPAPRRRILPAAAAALVLLVAGLFATTGLLEADHGGLRIEPERPTAGELLTVHYDGAFEFASDEFLTLKARYRTENGRVWEQIAGILERGDDGVFTTSLALPDSVVYATFAVEDLAGDNLDSNNGRLWDIVVFGDGGRPTAAALWERFLDVQMNSLPALETAVQLTEQYPDSPRGWALRFVMELETSARNADSARAAHKDRFRRLERSLTERPPSDPDELAAMAYYGAQLGETASAEFWLLQAERAGADGAILFIARSFLLWTDTTRTRSDALPRVEALWQKAPFEIAQLAELGWRTALEAGDWQEVLRWLPRYRNARGALQLAAIIDELQARFPAEQVITWAQEAADALLLAPTHRPMHRVAWLHTRYMNEVRQKALGHLAALARETGRLEAAHSLARQGLTLAWETEALESIGATLLEIGDTANAAEAFARAAADPMGAAPPDAVTADPRWARLLAGARSELTRYVLRESVMQFPDVELTSPDRAGVVVFDWSCDDSEERVPKLANAIGDAALHVVLVRYTGQTGRPSCDLPIPATVDWTGEISQSFGVLGVPTYSVIDAAGRVRFTASDFEDVPRQLAALRTEVAPRIAD